MKLIRGVLIIVLAAGIAPGLGWGRAAQEQEPSAPSNSAQAAPENDQPSSSDNPNGENGQAAPEAGKQHHHSIAAAAGKNAADTEERDETEPLKHSASVRILAKLFGGNVDRAYWAAVFINFAVIAGVAIWAARKFLPAMFSNRTAAIQKAMQEAQKASDEARRKLAEIESRLMRLDGEIGQMRDAAERDAAAEEARIIAGTEEELKKITAAASQEIEAAAKVARRELADLTAELAVGLAAKQIHVDPTTDQGLVESFSRGLNDVGAKGGR